MGMAQTPFGFRQSSFVICGLFVISLAALATNDE
jgi:hypothetical protein